MYVPCQRCDALVDRPGCETNRLDGGESNSLLKPAVTGGYTDCTAAFTNTELGRQWFQKAMGWTIAFILYKPAAAIVYAVAFQLMGSFSGTGALIGSITGFALMIVALLALPALMRFVTPMVGAVASGSGGGAAAAGAMATGAVSMGRSGSGRGNASPTPPSQPSKNGASPAGSQGPGGTNGSNAKPSPGSAGASGAGGVPGKGTTGSPGAATQGAGAGTAGPGAVSGAAKAAGPAGVAVAVGAQVASRVSSAAQQTAQDSTGEGPSGSN